jgi:hypothetical protein
MNVYKEFTMLHMYGGVQVPINVGALNIDFFSLGIHLFCEVSIGDVLGRLRIFLVSTFPTSDCRRVNVNKLL